ncbi:purine-nucleoside phosphorylase [Ideonella sp. A 288]|uniref:purine-nucleoside phosphorylase n=1 Tax=Ideonella sp. A 288 TaxID=1962181 RepID=UPI000B4AC8D9|nr:purine-nucleoside phosphorylase [Ideonella sp. A 288]
MTTTDKSAALDACIAHLCTRVGDEPPRVAVLLGSGWGALAGLVQQPRRIAYADLPGFPAAGVGGHAGELVLGRLGAQPVAVLAGRVHTYENDRADNMALPIRALGALGCQVLVQTNAAGSLDATMPPGSLMLLADHINLPQRSPLVGWPDADRFVAMTDAYDPALRRHAQAVAAGLGRPLPEGVYLWCLGPQFETPAEIRMAALMGAQAVGMSTVPETIVARHAGLRVLAMSLMTNMAAGLSTETLSHAHTLSQAQSAGDGPARLLAEVIGTLSL